MLSASRKGPAFKPQLRVCYLCGQQFGSASIGIHIQQCYTKKVSQWEIADPATRGKRPKHPDSVNWQGGEGISTDKLNDEQFHEFTSNLVPCKRCGRKFLPDRLVVHLRGCKGENGRGAPRGSGCGNNNGKGLGESGQSGTASKGGSPSVRKRPGGSFLRTVAHKPQLPICYLCGQQFGTSSIAIHIPQCYAKKVAQWEVADPATRGKPPKHPDTVNWKTDSTSIEEHNDAQFTEFMNNLEPCPNCGRRFLADRLVVHLRSCKPGATSKPITRMSSSPATEPRNNYSLHSDNENGNSYTPSRRSRPLSGLKSDTKDEEDSTKNLKNINPKVRRLPKNDKTSWNGVTCPRCGVIEYDSSAKFCRDCGMSLVAKNLLEPCTKCGEQIPEGSRFCGTCGVPINGAAAAERKEGVENANVPSIRVVACPACKAVCDADGNFCDNCGAVLGSADLLSAPGVTNEAMYCKTCREHIFDLSAKFCEDCGGTLEKTAVNGPKLNSKEKSSTLPSVGSGKEVESKTLDSSCSPARSKSSSNGARFSPSSKIQETTSEGKVTFSSRVPHEDARKVSKDGVAGQTRPSLLSQLKRPVMHNAAEVVDDDDDDGYETRSVGERLACGYCGRMFAQDALERHERVCARQKPRKQFNMRAVRLSGTGVENVKTSSSSSRRLAAGEAPKRDWRAESEAFRRSMREARMVDKVLKSGGNVRDLPPPTYSDNSHYTPCPHCGRRFAPDVAERHIPRCSTTINKPKPPPRRR